MKAPTSLQSKGSRVKREKRLYGETSCSDNFRSLISTETGLCAAMLPLLLTFPCVFLPLRLGTLEGGQLCPRGISQCLQWGQRMATLLPSFPSRQLSYTPQSVRAEGGYQFGVPRGRQCLRALEVGWQRFLHPTLQPSLTRVKSCSKSHPSLSHGDLSGMSTERRGGQAHLQNCGIQQSWHAQL